MNGSFEGMFSAARRAISRKAFRTFTEALGISDRDPDALKRADQIFRNTSFLTDAQLVAGSERALVAGRGRRIDEHERFPAMLWLGGARATRDGREFLGSFGDFVKVLRTRARETAAKRTGWVIEPVTNTDGHRCNASTVAVHALFLDCDGTGYWNRLLNRLESLDYAFTAYQSGGFTPNTPKWRLVIPLSQPYDTSDEEKQALWKGVYNHARVVFGSVAGLLSVGFDPATETPCCPWFLTEKREAGDPEREIVFRRQGHSLDVNAFLGALPPIEIEEVEGERAGGTVQEIELSDARMQQVVERLARETAFVPSGRRDLYMALPGVLLDRGVAGPDVIEICEMVSQRYPRQHHEKHADNVHCAHTTVRRWDAGGRVTRIGTLQAIAPTVASVIDELLPDPGKQGVAKAMEELFSDTPSVAKKAAAVVRPPFPTVTGFVPPTPPKPPAPAPRKRKLCEIAKQLKPIATRMRGSKVIDKQIDGLLIERLVHGLPIETDENVARAMRAVGQRLPLATKWQAVLDFASESLHAMGVTQSAERTAAAELAFKEGQGKRKVWTDKVTAESAAWDAAEAAAFGSKAK